MKSFSRVAIIAKPSPSIAPYLNDLLHIVIDSGCTPIVAESSAKHLPDPCPCSTCPDNELANAAEVLIVLGGDGTMLGAARLVSRSNIPVIGINAGRLGFITDVLLENMHEIIPQMLHGRYVEDKRRMLMGHLFRDGEKIYSDIAANDISITHGRALGMVHYTVYVDGLQMAVQRGDGVLVSTATGSTAYALASGGPILHPGINSMLLVPIAPHTLSNRPLVVPSSSTIDIELNESRSAVIGFDAQVLLDIAVGDVLRVAVSPDNYFTMLHPEGYNYFDLLRRKLKWSYLPEAEHPIASK
ncbi:MAG: NAD(+)/NADH kinase [Duodenibacillus sp.]|nr:NAD(+)/NADH kinase [Duodenibacillus sp.]